MLTSKSIKSLKQNGVSTCDKSRS